MLHKIKRNLIILNTVLTGITLSIIVLGICYINIRQIKEGYRSDFLELQDTIVYKLQNDYTISNEWLSKLEVENRAVIYIEDNGRPFFFKGAWTPSVPRETLVDKAKEEALSEGIDTTVNTVFSYKNSSSIISLSGADKEPAFAVVCKIPVKKGCLNLVLIGFRPNENSKIGMQIAFYLGIDLAGCFVLFLISYYFVGKVLKPAEESQRKQNEFIAAASHDLRTPLAVIQSNATTLLIGGADEKRFLPKIIEECKRMSVLIGDMLILASSDARTWQIRKEEVQTESYLIDLYDTYSALCRKKEYQLLLDFPEEALPKIYADKGRLTQIIGILIDNAVSYSPAGSSITLRPYVKKASFCIDVEDHGKGIPKEKREKIFDRFYQEDKSRNDNTHFGLGLSVAKELIELQGGRIYVKDTPQQGATFVVELPYSA
jgi:Signal transduction histidine kinase